MSSQPKLIKRYLTNYIEDDLESKMVFLAGPRQAGKTTLSLLWLRATNEADERYLNWDNIHNRRQIIRSELPAGDKVVFDELHKYKLWRNFIKGLYDKTHSSKKILVTGSARLDYYRRGGDSLQGRYHFYRLHPFSLFELSAKCPREILDKLLAWGGFPEPYFANSERAWKRWQNERAKRILREDLVDLEKVVELSQVEVLAELLRERAAGLLSIQSLREDISASHEAVARWVQILENLYYCFRIRPYTSKKYKGIKKEKKVYLWDWSLAPSTGPRFENLVASNLLKYCHYHEDVNGEEMELCFVRDKQAREIDFMVLKNRKPLMAIECKTGEKDLAPAICHFTKLLDVPVFYQVHLGKKNVDIPKYRARILPFEELAKILAV
ncbi:MAG: AAA family ATPase [Bdellovibrionota bacterium]